MVTHMHPDHVGGARDVAELTGAPVYQGRIDHAQCAVAWGERNPERFAEYWALHGMPRDDGRRDRRRVGRLVDAVHWVEQPDRLLDAGDEVDGWRVEVLPGHADGHIVLERDGVVIAGDTILMGITPAIGLYPNSRPDPLGDYLSSLRWFEERAPRVAYTGHREPVTDPAGRAAEIAVASRAPPRPRRGCARRDSALGVRRVARAVRRRPLDDASAVRDGRVTGASRAPRPRGPGRARGVGVCQARRYHDAMKPLRIGVLAVQGNFREHAQMLRGLGADVVEVRKADQLDGLDGLVIPGGESTTFTRLMRLYGLDDGDPRGSSVPSSARAPG